MSGCTSQPGYCQITFSNYDPWDYKDATHMHKVNKYLPGCYKITRTNSLTDRYGVKLFIAIPFLEIGRRYTEVEGKPLHTNCKFHKSRSRCLFFSAEIF